MLIVQISDLHVGSQFLQEKFGFKSKVVADTKDSYHTDIFLFTYLLLCKNTLVMIVVLWLHKFRTIESSFFLQYGARPCGRLLCSFRGQRLRRHRGLFPPGDRAFFKSGERSALAAHLAVRGFSIQRPAPVLTGLVKLWFCGAKCFSVFFAHGFFCVFAGPSPLPIHAATGVSPY